MGIAIGEKTELSLTMAGESLNRMLVGAHLDCFSVSSITVSLRFINDGAFPGISLYVDNDFSCGAVMRGGDNLVMENSVGGFFTKRAKFLSGVYSCIGKEVTKVNLSFDGSLSISVGDSVIAMQLEKEDKEQEDYVWKVEMEAPAGHLVSEVNSVMCVPNDGGVKFLS
ncbi:hypothetical protein [Stenotrophomonas tumulicola]|uniref:Uncharacterized protein n=1 Tax=Stenotrophomonas tumulicola TaxID=1685415 RepID=A0A7W3FMQ9_9GAMM|nr:hypothetical protein [Stenotrophomonas tumulicola]MBA8682423.1 hypothetical protein [Stenotrophomonas tumulicola]